MNIRIPILIPRFLTRFLTRTWDSFEDWGNVVVWESARGRFYVLRLDVLSAVGFIVCVAYYYFFHGWRGALQGAAAYIFVSMTALWFFRPDRESRTTQ